MSSIVWYDYETFGSEPKWDRPAQFAAIRTDLELNEIEPPVELFCRQADDYLPHPEAVLITGITPQDCQRNGLSESEFIQRINQMFSQPGTCSAGYNSIRFDDEVTRYTLYRNFLDPYAREWQNGNSRWDLLDVVRCAYALRPEGIEWPLNEEGKQSFRLEHLTASNGIDHGQAHDAVADVRATIAMAKLIKQKQPRLFEFLYRQRSKQALADLLNPAAMKPVIHISGMYPADQGCMAVVLPLCPHPSNRNSVIVYDLSHDPQPLFDLNPEQIQQRVFTRKEDLPADIERLPLKEIHLNKAAVVVPISTLTPERAAHWKIDGDQLRRHLQLIKTSAPLTEKLHQVYQTREFNEISDVDGQLYHGFFSEHDRRLMSQVHELNGEQLLDWQHVFEDSRGEEMMFRFRARNFPDSLEGEDRQRWETHRRQRLLATTKQPWLTFNEFAPLLQAAAERVAGDPVKLQWLHDLQLYAESIYPFDDF